MADRTYCEVICSKTDEAVFKELGFEWAKDLTKKAVCMVNHEADGGNYERLLELSGQGYVFLAYHGQGSTFDPCAMVSDGKTFLDVLALEAGKPLLRTDENGNTNPEDLVAAKRYRTAAKIVRKKLGLTP